MNDNSMMQNLDNSENHNSSIETSNSSTLNNSMLSNNSFHFKNKKKEKETSKKKIKVQNEIFCKKTNKKFIPHSEELIKHFETCDECKLSQFYYDSIKEEEINEINKKKRK